jgi:manganese efflux pump family protein
MITAFGLAMDAFAVSLSVGASPAGRNPRAVFRIAFHTGLFQGLMTLLGWLAGSSIALLIEQWDHWVVFFLLGWVGFRMIREGLQPGDPCNKPDPTRGGMLLMVCVATSIDAMAVGLSMAMLKVDVISASLLIAVVTLVLATLGCLIGGSLGTHFGKRMEIVGGLILNGIGLRVLLTSLFPVIFM